MIEAYSLSKKFDNRGIAGIHGLSLKLKSGEVLGIMGPNGSGKSTLLNILSGKLAPDSGTFSTEGEVKFFPSVEALPTINVQKYLIQSVVLDIEDEKKLQLSRDLADTFEFTFQLRQNLDQVSSGQKQKILLAKELINNPSLLLMDEPFTHLDPFTRKDILNSLFKFIRHQGITVLWVTHDLNEAFRYSDQVAVMNFGKFEQQAPPLEMVQKPKNLFVAKFMGYRNFFTTKKVGDSWETLWGKKELPSISSEDGVLIVPDDYWTEDNNGLSFTITQRHASIQNTEYTLEFQERTCYLVRNSQLPLLECGDQVSLVPRLDGCLHLAL